jgi:hypothetical protein
MFERNEAGQGADDFHGEAVGFDDQIQLGRPMFMRRVTLGQDERMSRKQQKKGGDKSNFAFHGQPRKNFVLANYVVASRGDAPNSPNAPPASSMEEQTVHLGRSKFR